MRLTCPQCQTTYELEDERVPRGGAPVQCTRCQHVFRAAWPGYSPGYTQMRIVPNPLRRPPRRAWLFTDARGADGWWVLPLTPPLVRLSGELLVLPPEDPTAEVARFSFAHGRWAVVLPRMTVPFPLAGRNSFFVAGHSLVFSESGAFEVKAHQAALDERPLEEAPWFVWADELVEQGDPLGGWLMERRRSDLELEGQLGAAAPLVGAGVVSVTWNRFGFLESLKLPVRVLEAHPFCLDPQWVPAVRYLQRLELTAQLRGEVTVQPLRGEAVVPRSLRWLGVHLPEPDAPYRGADGLLDELRERCPFLQTTEETLFLPPEPLAPTARRPQVIRFRSP